MIIAIDFDGTCVSHEYPNVGEDIGAVPVLKKMVADGHKLILYTMRSGDKLEEAKKWFEDNGIELYDANHCPGQESWTSSPKVHANIYIDDAALGCPLTKNGDKWYVNWMKIAEAFGYNYVELCK